MKKRFEQPAPTPAPTEEQLDLFKKPDAPEAKKQKRIYSEEFMEKTFGQGGAKPAEESRKSGHEKSGGHNLVHPRHNRPIYPLGHHDN
ncbi:MAG: hypothetical protein PHS62_01040 [Patescibacteria group bacterium]|nr:hypothetical protein [Patescibacteria group bacterium]